MCGIFCCVACGTDISPILEPDNLTRIKQRGPDFWFTQCIKFRNIDIFLANSVLHLRGDNVNYREITYKNDQSYLLWNGEIFGGYEIPPNRNDTEMLFNLLNSVDSDEEIINILCKIQGPFAFIYLQQKEEKLWFGRDVLGRRSLLWQFTLENKFKLSSVIDDNNDKSTWHEVPANGIFYLNLKDIPEKHHLIHFPWSNQMEKLIEFHHFQIEASHSIPNPISCTLNKELPLEIDLKTDNDLLELPEFQKTLHGFIHVLQMSVKNRVENQPKLCKNCLVLKEDSNISTCLHSKTGILFSGGIDSSVLALLADKFVPKMESIDLFNVAFVKKIETFSDEFEVPDRVTGRIALEELKMISPNRKWNFVEINITTDELQEKRLHTISSLINPCNTVLDDSIGCSIWFAARGIGQVSNETEFLKSYTSPCRVLLVGMGADEQLAGYSRHRMRYMNNGWQGLIEEIEMEISRISFRNLGRDDRVIADHGREARFPFLDESVVEFLNNVPIWFKANLNLPRGSGEKLLLRCAAKILGFDRVCTFAKRAIQFGTRIAKVEERKQKGSDVMC